MGGWYLRQARAERRTVGDRPFMLLDRGDIAAADVVRLVSTVAASAARRLRVYTFDRDLNGPGPSPCRQGGVADSG
jgi:hypothetical protein